MTRITRIPLASVGLIAVPGFGNIPLFADEGSQHLNPWEKLILPKAVECVMGCKKRHAKCERACPVDTEGEPDPSTECMCDQVS